MPQDCGFPVAAGPVRFAGNDLDRPQDLAPRQPGRYGIGPYGGAGGSAAMRRRLWRGGGCGTMQASSPTQVCNAARLRFSGGCGPRPVCRERSRPSAGPCAAATGPILNRPLRRCGRGCGHAAAFMAGRGCGTMQASSPTRVCDAARLRFSGWPRALSGLQGTVLIVRRALHRGNRADMESAPTAVREGLRPCGGVYGRAGVRQMRHCCIPHKEIYARRRKLRAYILQDI